MPDCVLGAENKTRIDNMATKEVEQDHRMDKIDIMLDKVRNRPTWLATTIISVLASTCVGLIVARFAESAG